MVFRVEGEGKKLLYIISMIVLLGLYVGVIINMKRMKNTKLFNYIFSAAVLACYLFVVFRNYFEDGFYDWNFQNTLPVANVSNFVLTDNSYLSAALYFFGLLCVLGLGGLYSYLLSRNSTAAIVDEI